MAKTEHGAAVGRAGRPLSPHLQVYRLPLAAIMSILHRVTGVGNVIGMLFISWWFIAAATGPEAFAWADGFLTSWLGILMLIGFALSICYHLCTGLRHLVWDAGFGFDKDSVKLSSYVVFGGAAFFALILLIVGLAY